MNSMEEKTPSFLQPKLFVCLYSDPNFFSLNILENLLSKNCLVNVITSDVKKWRELTKNLNKTKYGITPVGSNHVRQIYSYSIYVGGFIKKDEAYTEFKDFLNDPAIKNIKSIAIFPFEKFDVNISKLIPINDNLSVIYLGDVIGPRMNLESDLYISESLNEMLFKRKLTIVSGEIFYPVFASDAAKTITKWLFSFGPYGKEIFLLGNPVPITDFWKENKRLIPELTMAEIGGVTPRILPRGYEMRYLNCNLYFALAETYKWITKNWKEDEVMPSFPTFKIKKPTRKKPLPKYVKPVSIFLAVILLLPFVTTLISGSIVFLSYRQFVEGKNIKLEDRMLVAKTFFAIGKSESNMLSFIPILGRLYKETSFISLAGIYATDMTVEALPLVDNSKTLFENILGDTIYDPSPAASELKTVLGSLHNNLSLIEAEAKDSSGKGVISARVLLAKVDFERFKTLTSKGEVLADNLPSLLGKDVKKSYLVLFENNMELRPTGGFIGSFGVTNFDGGRMNELIVNDVYSADGQLKGHVEPPLPIKNYLGEANWFLRDSNWDPDFPTSAQRAEWFLDKEMDQRVNGVVSVDLELVREVLRYTGPVFLPDFNMDITEENLYEKTQAEVQDNFFPGTHKKASFLTALSRNLIAEVTKLDNAQKLNILKTILSNLEGRHMQIYLHDEVSQNAISDIGWGGGVQIPTCGPGCSPDFVGISEANLGVNKANYFIERTANLDIKLTPEVSVKRLSLDLFNRANPALGPSGRYKSYVRILIPANSVLLGVKSIVGEHQEDLNSETVNIKDRKEVGVLVETLGDQKQRLEFSWQNPLPTEDMSSYGLYIRKQAGVGNDPWTVKIISGIGKLTGSPWFSLTRDGIYTYNMALTRDSASIFTIKK